MQKIFIQYLKEKSAQNASFVDEMADVLDIGYDAAYRRINLKTNLSLEESVKLAKYYKISLNKLFEVGSKSTIVTELSPRPDDEKGLEDWLNSSYENLYPLTQLKNASMIYAAKDIPVFHTLKDTYLSRYKMYVWLKDNNIEMTKNKITFDKFIRTIPESLLQSAYKTAECYENINLAEIWTNTTINGTLQQVIYYFESGFVSKELALKICDDIEEVIKHIEEQAILQSHSGSKKKSSYHLYLNEIHSMSNTIMVVTPFQKVFFTPFTVLSYFKIEHQETCDLMYDYYQKFMNNSKLLANTGEKDRTLFFNRMHHKINKLRDQINANNPFSFE
ncbi:hypothetical protein [uncultured Algibacter sp.]|uniref:hypothetical protein n=1 Tax=uncultured Algibacter sp. TaxID=298659 RepID=UPI002601C40A|nr:hypothetical protein [uncultured Algibacter sp.]